MVDQWKINITNGVFKENTKRILSKSDLENVTSDFPGFIIIESLEEICQAKFFSFQIEKVIYLRVTPRNVKKTRNGNLLEEVNSQRQVENILKMKTFHMTHLETYPHEKSNRSKEVVRSR